MTFPVDSVTVTAELADGAVHLVYRVDGAIDRATRRAADGQQTAVAIAARMRDARLL
jgi:hypothetical protein